MIIGIYYNAGVAFRQLIRTKSEGEIMKKTRQILAVIGIVLLLSMYLACLILAITGKHQATTLFKAALGATVAVPIVLYAFMMLLKVFPPFVKNEENGEGSDEEAGPEEEADPEEAEEAGRDR